jgi:hypothetical protein
VDLNLHLQASAASARQTPTDPNSSTQNADDVSPTYERLNSFRGAVVLASVAYIGFAELVLYYNLRDIYSIYLNFLSDVLIFNISIQIYWILASAKLEALNLQPFTASLALFNFFLSIFYTVLLRHFGADYDTSSVPRLLMDAFSILLAAWTFVLLRLGSRSASQWDCLGGRFTPFLVIFHITSSLAILFGYYSALGSPLLFPLISWPLCAACAAFWAGQFIWVCIEVWFEARLPRRARNLRTIGRVLIVIMVVGIVLPLSYQWPGAIPHELSILLWDIPTAFIALNSSAGVWILIWPIVRRILKSKFNIDA